MLDAIKKFVGQTNRHVSSPHLKCVVSQLATVLKELPNLVFINLISSMFAFNTTSYCAKVVRMTGGIFMLLYQPIMTA